MVMSPMLAEQVVLIPAKDIISWYFDEPSYDHERPIYVDAQVPEERWTANQCRTVIRQLAAGFQRVGLQIGDSVCIHGFNSIDYPVLANGIVAAGGVFTGSNPGYTTYELVHHLKTAEVKLAIVDPDLESTFLAAAAEVRLPHNRIFSFSRLASDLFPSWVALTENGERDWIRINNEKTAKDTVAALLFSSGTTGLPKAAMLSHHNFVGQCTILGDMKGTGWHKRRIIALPMFHASTVPTVHFNPLRTGETMYILRRFELESFLQNIERHSITDVSVVPPIINRILGSPLRFKYSLKSTPLTQVWGMTETVATCCMTPYTEGREITGSVGKMAPNIDVKLCDDDGNDITADDLRGEICIRGPMVIKGYFRNEEANKRDWDEEGYFHTGDIAYRDSQTRLWYIVDRKKELIKVRGFQVAPSELEGVLICHPRIQDAAVVAVDQGGEDRPRAYVVGVDVSAEEIHAYLKEHLASFKQCTGGVIFVKEVPRTGSGKILRRTVREWATREHKL